MINLMLYFDLKFISSTHPCNRQHITASMIRLTLLNIRCPLYCLSDIASSSEPYKSDTKG